MRELILSLLALLTLASCSKNETIEQPYNEKLRITPGIQTRVNSMGWEKGDAIGVTMFKAGTTDAIGKPNTQYISKRERGHYYVPFEVVAPDVDLVYPNSKVDIWAYYPYSASANGKSIDIDMVNEQTYLMLAKVENVAESKTAIDIPFNNFMSRILVGIHPGEGLTADDIAEGKVKVTLVGTKTKATFDLADFNPTDPASTKIIKNLSTVADLNLKFDGNNMDLKVGNIIPQPLGNNVALVFEVDGFGIFTKKITSLTTTSFLPRNAYYYILKLSRTGVELVSSSITAWTDDSNNTDNYGIASESTYASKAEVGMYYYKNGKYSKSRSLSTATNPIIGIIYNVSNDGTNGKVVSLDEGHCSWSTHESININLGANSSNDGFTNMRTVFLNSQNGKTPNSFDKYPAFQWIHQKNIDANASFDGLTGYYSARGVWFFPALDELKEILQAVESYGKSDFDNKLTNANGTALSDSDYYSSTEVDGYSVQVLSFGSDYSGMVHKMSQQFVRAILLF